MLFVSNKLVVKWQELYDYCYGRHLLKTDGVGVYFKSGLSCGYKDKSLYVPYSVGIRFLMPHVKYFAFYTLEQPGQMKDEPSHLLASKLSEYCIVFDPSLQPTFPLYLSLSFFRPRLLFVLFYLFSVI